MVEQELVIDIREIQQGLILDLKGDLNKQAEQKLLGMQDWGNGLPQGKAWLILNFNQVHYMNSHGIAILIRLVRAGTEGGFKTLAYGLSTHYAKLLRMVGLTEFLHICTDEEEALRRMM